MSYNPSLSSKREHIENKVHSGASTSYKRKATTDNNVLEKEPLFTRTPDIPIIPVTKINQIESTFEVTGQSRNANNSNLFEFTYTGPSLIGMK
jgi:hypothetical protein